MKDWILNNKRKVWAVLGLLILLTLPLTLVLIRQTQNYRSSAAPPDKLEAEQGVMSGAVQTLSDSLASGGQYVKFVTNQTTPAPTFTPAGAQGNIYGPLAVGDSLNNPKVGGAYNQKNSYRFRATETSKLNAVRVYIVDETHPGYGAGTGGTMRITVRTDDGSTNHFPSGTILATQDIPSPNDGAGQRYAFSSPPSLTKGQLYHIVFENIDPDPVANFVSLDGMFQFDMSGTSSKWQPGLDNIDWAHLVKINSGQWSTDRGSGKGTITPIMQLEYSNGTYAGVGYMEFWAIPSRSQTKTITGANNKIREVITVSGGDKTVTGVNIKSKRVSGTGSLNIRLETGSSSLIEQGSISSSQIPIGDPNDITDSPDWAYFKFKNPHTLTNGQIYNLVFSTDSSSSYNFLVIRKGKSYGYKPVTYFADGQAQETSDGTTWVYPISWTVNSNPRSPEGDWQFNFSLQ